MCRDLRGRYENPDRRSAQPDGGLRGIGKGSAGKKMPAVQFPTAQKNTDKNADPGQEREFMESVCRVWAKYQKNPELNPVGGPLPERAQISHGMSRKRLFCVENNGKITAADKGSE